MGNTVAKRTCLQGLGPENVCCPPLDLNMQKRTCLKGLRAESNCPLLDTRLWSRGALKMNAKQNPCEVGHLRLVSRKIIKAIVLCFRCIACAHCCFFCVQTHVCTLLFYFQPMCEHHCFFVIVICAFCFVCVASRVHIAGVCTLLF